MKKNKLPISGKGKGAIIVGRRGEGKTTFLKETFLKKSKKDKYVFARVTDDYLDVPNVKLFTDFTEFLKVVKTKSDIIIVIDEAYTVLPKEIRIGNVTDESIIVFLVNCRKLNNFVFIVNHSLKQTYLWELDYADFFVRFNTNDLIQHQKNRFVSFEEITDSLERNPKINKFEYDEIIIR